MRTEFIDLHFCVVCGRSTEHIKFMYMDEGTITCQVCQNTEDFVAAEELVKKTFTIVSVDEKDRNANKRRIIKVELRVEITPDSLGETDTSYEDIFVEYPAHGEDHFTAQVCYTDKHGSPNYKDARAISKAIKQFIGKD